MVLKMIFIVKIDTNNNNINFNYKVKIGYKGAIELLDIKEVINRYKINWTIQILMLFCG
jgi:hypothetical protein